MVSFVDAAFLALCITVGAESMVLLFIVQETLRLKAIDEPSPITPDNPLEARLGTKIPSFRMHELYSAKVHTDVDLRRQSSAVVFVKAHDELARQNSATQGALRSLWNNSNGDLYVVCIGTANECRRYSEHYALQGTYGKQVKVLLDEQNHLATLLGIPFVPAGLVVDRHGVITKVGTFTSSIE